MNYCNNCDIVYEERNCPLCEAKQEIESLKDELYKNNVTIDDLKHQLE